MPVFTYRGTNRAGATVTGERTATTKAELHGHAAAGRTSTSASSPRRARNSTFPTFGGTGVKDKELADLHAPVLGDDRRRLAARAVPGNSRRPAGEQDLSEDPERRARLGGRRRDALGVDEAVRQSVRPALLQHGGSGRDGRYSRHDSAAPLDRTSKRTSS